MTKVVSPSIPDFNYLPSLCSAHGCLSDPAPGRLYCWRHLKSRVAQAQEIRERKQSAIKRRLERISPSLKAQLYVIGAAESDLIKFGISAKPKERMYDLQIASPVTLILFGHIGCDRPLEKEVHRYCDSQRVRGEWFRREDRAATIAQLVIDGDLLGIYRNIGLDPPWSLT